MRNPALAPAVDDHNIAVRVQRLPLGDQVLVLARLAEGRSGDRKFSPAGVSALFAGLGLPSPANINNALAGLRRAGSAVSLRERGAWRLTPEGLLRSQEVVSDVDLAVLGVEAAAAGPSFLGGMQHSLLPPTLAPLSLLPDLRDFLRSHPFETNVFGMTRFPEEGEDVLPDPVNEAIEAARRVCSLHGLEFHLASDRVINDDLWTNVAAHMWASKYGIAFFEDCLHYGLNYNLTIEVGAMLMAGRRLALLKDESIARLPTDLVGRIYRSVDLSDPSSVDSSLHSWIRDDLGLGPCSLCTTRGTAV